MVRRQGALLLARVWTRDDLHLGPALISQAAARRLKAGLRALEAYLRRVLFLLALSFEAGLSAANHPRIIYARAPRKASLVSRFRLFVGEQALPDSWSDSWRGASSIPQKPLVFTAPYLARLRDLRGLLKAPEARARRLAWSLARRRPGLLLAPDAGDVLVPRRYGTEVSAHYASLGPAIIEASRARPPPLGAVPLAGPRIRRL